MPLSPTGIEYILNPDGTQGRNWQIVSGCENWRNPAVCGGGKDFYCWAKRLVEGRLKRLYPFGFEPTYYPERLRAPYLVLKPQTIAVSFMGDLFGDWPCWKKDVELGNVLMPMAIVRQRVFEVVRGCPQHRFMFLTKCPWNLAKYNPWPNNAWVGVSATTSKQFVEAHEGLIRIRPGVRFISFEPLLEPIVYPGYPLHVPLGECADWVIVGAATKPLKLPQRAWVQEIEAACDEVGIKLWLKDNMRPLLGDKLRKEVKHD